MLIGVFTSNISGTNKIRKIDCMTCQYILHLNPLSIHKITYKYEIQNLSKSLKPQIKMNKKLDTKMAFFEVGIKSTK